MWFQGKDWKKTRQNIINTLNTLDIENSLLVVALSGGKDSLFLLTALASLEDKYSFELLPVHINHKIQKENKLFENIAKTQAKKLGKVCNVLEIEAIDKKKNLEEELRDKRYGLLEKFRKENKAKYIITAHHLDDQAETILAHIIRGSGIQGLKGMKARNNKVIRPILNTSRAEIEKLIHSTNLPYYEDRMNYSKDYQRGKIRNVLIPLLGKEFNPQISKHLAKLGDLAQKHQNDIKKIL